MTMSNEERAREWWARVMPFLTAVMNEAIPTMPLHQEAVWLFEQAGSVAGTPPADEPPPTPRTDLFTGNDAPAKLPYRLAVEALQPADVVGMLMGLFGTMQFDEAVAKRLHAAGVGHLVGRPLTVASFISPCGPPSTPSGGAS